MKYVINRLWKAFQYSSAGLLSCYKSEFAFRFELFLLITAIPFTIWIAKSYLDYVLLLGSIILIMIVELLNSAIEKVNDRIGKEYSELCKQAKDQSSAAVFLAIILSIIIWTSKIIINFKLLESS